VHSVAVEHPSKLCVSGDVALYEKGIFLRVKTARNVESKCLISSSAKLCRVLTDCYSVKVNDAVNAVIALLELPPILDGPEIVTDSQLSAWLDSRKYCFLLNYFIVFHKYATFTTVISYFNIKRGLFAIAVRLFCKFIFKLLNYGTFGLE
jgi:hypothetical protein